MELVRLPRNPLVSVIVPTHNRPDHLAEALRSLIGQTCHDWEALVVDNGPGQRIPNVVTAFADERLRYVYQPEGNRSLARNLGAQIARARYLAFLDDDDRFLPAKLEQQVAFLDRHPEVGLVGCGARIIDGKGQFLEEWPLWEYSPQLCLEQCIQGCLLMPTVVLMRRTWFARVRGFNPELPPVEDTDLFLRLMLAGCRMAWLRTFLCEHRVHAGSSQHDPVAYAKSREVMIDRILNAPDLPAKIQENANEIRAFYASYAFADCFVAGKYDSGRLYLDRAVSLQPVLREEGGYRLVESILSAAGNREIHDPYGVVTRSLTALNSGASITPKVRRHALAKAAQMSFYKGHRLHSRSQVWRSFWRATLRQPAWLLKRGTWSILFRTLASS